MEYSAGIVGWGAGSRVKGKKEWASRLSKDNF